MTDHLEEFSAKCAGVNAAVSRCMSLGGVSLGEYAGMMADKVRRNRKERPLRDPGDFYSCTAEYVEKRLGRDAAHEVYEAVSLGTMNSADHHGALFCSQTFQGDLLFGEVLRRLGYGGRHVPIHSGGQVELGNVTYARGFCLYNRAEEKHLIPVFPYKDKNRMSSHATAVTGEMIAALYRRMEKADEDPDTKRAVADICEAIWSREDIPRNDRLSDQTVDAGIRLSAQLFSSGGGPLLTYVELEDTTAPLLKKEILDPRSLISHILFDPAVRECMQHVRTKEGVPLSGLLFRNADYKGRKSLLTLNDGGELLGRGWRGEELRYKVEPDEICRLMDEGRIFPGMFLIALAIAFERGVTLMGGMFQAQYLPDWQSCLAKLLEDCGFRSESAIFASYECDGYICGPMFAVYEGDGFAAGAGPVEFHMILPEWEQVREQMLSTGLRDAHIIGLSEMYYDLIPPQNQEAGWYESISRELYRRFPSNVLQGRIPDPEDKGKC